MHTIEVIQARRISTPARITALLLLYGHDDTERVL